MVSAALADFPVWLEGTLVVFGGLLAGSYGSLLSWRLPLGEPTAIARSRCPGCGRTLGPRDLVPILSWLIARGRCRCGEMQIPLRYPLIELTTAAAALSIWLVLGITWQAGLFFVWSFCLITLSVAALAGPPTRRGALPRIPLAVFAATGTAMAATPAAIAVALSGAAGAAVLAIWKRFLRPPHHPFMWPPWITAGLLGLGVFAVLGPLFGTLTAGLTALLCRFFSDDKRRLAAFWLMAAALCWVLGIVNLASESSHSLFLKL